MELRWNKRMEFGFLHKHGLLKQKKAGNVTWHSFFSKIFTVSLHIPAANITIISTDGKMIGHVTPLEEFHTFPVVWPLEKVRHKQLAVNCTAPINAYCHTGTRIARSRNPRYHVLRPRNLRVQ